ncbi:fimbrial protein [Providencia manganoxydans]|uniref:fimbrial protein n=1 Tax=Providencia manganoxydans TaxID=2923283 RepID=UPI0032DAAFDC
MALNILHHLAMKMKTSFFLSTLFIAGIGIGLPFQTYADLGKINLRINATIISNTCRVSAKTANQTVNLGNWGARQFSVDGSATTTPIPFQIVLEDCGPAVKSMRIHFDGQKNSQNNQLYALNTASTASRIGVAILDHTYRRLPPNTNTSTYNLKPTPQGIPLQFYAQYVATGQPVLPGSANTEATFYMQYD